MTCQDGRCEKKKNWLSVLFNVTNRVLVLTSWMLLLGDEGSYGPVQWASFPGRPVVSSFFLTILEFVGKSNNVVLMISKSITKAQLGFHVLFCCETVSELHYHLSSNFFVRQLSAIHGSSACSGGRFSLLCGCCILLLLAGNHPVLGVCVCVLKPLICTKHKLHSRRQA